jgi:4-hydroxybenzoate polyprenyltransferase
MINSSVTTFLHETEPEDKKLWCILVLDRHKTHITAELIKKESLNKVWLIWMFSRSSHITQPLDVAIFSALKAFYHQGMWEWASYETTSPQQKQLSIKAYKISSKKAFTVKNIQSDFRASGIYPTDVEKVLLALCPKRPSKAQKSPLTTPTKR